jgi:hypothetical protein
MSEPTMTENIDAVRFLTQAYADGAAPMPKAFNGIANWVTPGPLGSMAKALAAQERTKHRIDREFDQWCEPARDTRRIQYQDVWYDLRTRLDRPGTCYEVARFIVAPDEVGIVRKVGTYAAIFDDPDIVQLNPLDPWALQRAGVEGLWFVRLWQNTFGPMPAPDVGIPFAQIGGYPFPELPNWQDNRFQWGRLNSEVFWLVPSNHALRLYFWYLIDDSNILREIGGRLVGFTQPIETLPAAKNVLYAW